MCIEYLYFTKDGMGNEYAGSRFADKPVTGYNINGCTIEGVWMYACPNNSESREYSKACSKSTTEQQFIGHHTSERTTTHL
jgi:hypothetical protein